MFILLAQFRSSFTCIVSLLARVKFKADIFLTRETLETLLTMHEIFVIILRTIIGLQKFRIVFHDLTIKKMQLKNGVTVLVYA